MSLIQGMEDIMTHIKNQELRIQKLQEENEKLKELFTLIKTETDKVKDESDKWKEISLRHWSGDALGGDIEPYHIISSDVWYEALEQANNDSDYDREELSKKCMEAK